MIWPPFPKAISEQYLRQKLRLMHDDAFLVFSLPNLGIVRDTIILFCLLYILINVAQYSSLKSG